MLLAYSIDKRSINVGRVATTYALRFRSFSPVVNEDSLNSGFYNTGFAASALYSISFVGVCRVKRGWLGRSKTLMLDRASQSMWATLIKIYRFSIDNRILSN